MSGLLPRGQQGSLRQRVCEPSSGRFLPKVWGVISFFRCHFRCLLRRLGHVTLSPSAPRCARSPRSLGQGRPSSRRAFCRRASPHRAGKRHGGARLLTLRSDMGFFPSHVEKTKGGTLRVTSPPCFFGSPTSQVLQGWSFQRVGVKTPERQSVRNPADQRQIRNFPKKIAKVFFVPCKEEG